MSDRIHHISGQATGFLEAISRSPSWHQLLLGYGVTTDLLGKQAPTVTEVLDGDYILWWIDDVSVSASITGTGTQREAIVSTSGLKYILFSNCSEDDIIETAGTGPILHLIKATDSYQRIIRMDKRFQNYPDLPYLFIDIPNITVTHIAINAYSIKATTDIKIYCPAVWNNPTINDYSDIDFDLISNLAEDIYNDIHDQYDILNILNYQPLGYSLEIIREDEEKAKENADVVDYVYSRLTIETQGFN